MSNPIKIQIPTQIPNPNHFELSQSEFQHLETIQDNLFELLNSNHPLSLKYGSDQLMVLYIIIQRQLKEQSLPSELNNIFPILLKINVLPTLN